MDKGNLNSTNNEKGLAIPEFMISFPVLLILLFGSIDLGSLLQQYLLVQHAAAIGAEKIQTLPSINNLEDCATATENSSSSTDESVQLVIEKMDSVLQPSTDKLNTTYSFCQKQVNGKPSIQIQVSATYKHSNQLFQLKSARLNAKVEVPYFFGG